MLLAPHSPFAKVSLAVVITVSAGWWLFYPPRPTASTSDRHPFKNPAPALALPSAADSPSTLLALARIRLARSPAVALAWTNSISDPDLRQRALLAVAEAWGEIDPASTTAWALQQNPDTLRADLQAALTGATRQSPVAALQIGRDLLAQNSPFAGTYGTALIAALGTNNQFPAAVQFAATASLDYREDWLASSFRQWAQAQPANAFAALDSVTDDSLRDTVIRAAVQGASTGQPAILADYAVALPEGDARSYALDQTMFRWSRQDPAALATWLARVPPGPSYDNGAFFILTENNPAALGPANALNWAQSIGDSGLRQTSFWRVFDQWSQADPAAVRSYVQSAPGLTSSDRTYLLQNLPAH